MSPPAHPSRVVLMLHGILLNRWFLRPLELFLRSKGHRTLNISYPSTRKRIEECASFVAERVAREMDREPFTEIDLVTHSLGGMVGRRLITLGLVPPARRLVQLVPPNRGSAMARGMREIGFYRALYGTGAGWQLGEDPEEIDRICGIPEEIEWGIVMGMASHGIRDSLLESPHDGVVSHSEMRMPGLSLPSVAIEMMHTPLQFMPEAWREVACFLDLGRFRRDEDLNL